MSLHDELNRRISYLAHIGFQEARARYAAFLDWLEAQPSTSQILTHLREVANIALICAGCSPHRPPKAGTPEEIARVGLYFFEHCKEDQCNLPGLFIGLGLHSKWGGNNINGYFAEAQDTYINPFLDYLLHELSRQDEALYADDVAAFRVNMIFSDEFAVRFPRTSLQLNKISKELFTLDHSGNWYNAANSCREVLKRYVVELYEVLGEQIPDDMKIGDVKGLLKHVLSKRYGAGKMYDTLVGLIQSVWDHTQCLLHREQTNRDEAIRVYLWTALLISEIFEIVKC